jgi:benzoylformate decarboxylase
MGTTMEATHFVGTDFTDPDVNVERIAAGFGARTDAIKNPGGIGDALDRALAHDGPSFLIIAREP